MASQVRTRSDIELIVHTVNNNLAREKRWPKQLARFAESISLSVMSLRLDWNHLRTKIAELASSVRDWSTRPEGRRVLTITRQVALAAGLIALIFLLIPKAVFAQVSLPGTDASDQLEAAGTLLRIVDTALFKWGARVFAGICIFSAGWSLKEQRFGLSVICIIGAIIFGTAPMWVKNIFSIGGSDSLFSQVEIHQMYVPKSGQEDSSLYA